MDLLQHVADQEARRNQCQLIGGTARIREDLTNLRQQLSAATDDAVDALQLSIGDRAEEAVTENLGVRDHGRERRPKVMRDVGEELRLQLIASAQVGDLLERRAELELQRRKSIVDASGGCRHCFRFRFDSRHSANPPSVTGCTNSMFSSSSAIASSSCCLLRSAQ